MSSGSIAVGTWFSPATYPTKRTWRKRRHRGAQVLIGDPRRHYLALDRLECLIEYRVPVTRALEDSEIKLTGVFAFRAPDRFKE
jgi:predicted nicotinamide N-methyase